MLKIIKLPSIIQSHAKIFKNIFKNKAQFKHFKQYLTGLMLCENKTIEGIQSKFINSGSVNSLDHFMIRSQWSETELNDKRVLHLQRNKETKSKPEGVVSIDDTLTHNTGKHRDDAEIHFDHATGKFVLGHHLVSIQYKDRNMSYPIDYRQYYRKPTKKQLIKEYKKLNKQIDFFNPKQYLIEKLKLLLNYQKRLQRFISKIELSIELIHKTESLGIKAKTYAFDSWLLCNKIVNVIESYGKDWISVLKSNRNLIIKNNKISVSNLKYSFTTKTRRYKVIKNNR